MRQFAPPPDPPKRGSGKAPFLRLQFGPDRETHGKYAVCDLAADGFLYAREDMVGGKPKRGALPAPKQYNDARTAAAIELHERAAKRFAARALRALRPWWRFW